MTREEAVEVVKSNWPPAHYTMLAEALTVLIAHDDAIRRECAREIIAEAKKLSMRDNPNSDSMEPVMCKRWWWKYSQALDSMLSTLGTEPAREES